MADFRETLEVSKIGFVPNIDNIRVITIERDHDKAIVYRVEF